MLSWRAYLAASIAVVAVLIAGATLIERYTLNRLLYNDAVATRRQWTEYLVRSIPDLDRIAAGDAPSAASKATLERAKIAGQIFLYKIHDAEGHPRFVSDDLPEGERR